MSTYAVQLYSVRDAAQLNFKDTLRQVAELGYTGVEFAGFFGFSAAEVKAWLSEYNLRAVGSHVGLELLAPDTILETIAFHRELGCTELTVPAANWSDEAHMHQNLLDLAYASRVLASEGMRLSYHNHAKEFVKAPYGVRVMDEILQNTDVWLEPDSFWLHAVGIDPVQFCEAHQSRICMIHLKDGIPAPAITSFELSNRGTLDRSLGEGNVPVLSVLAWAREKGVPIIVESEGLDPTGLDEVKRCMEFLQKR